MPNDGDTNQMTGAQGFDAHTAQVIRDLCSGADKEINGCILDQIMDSALRTLGMTETADAAKAVEAWRA